MYEVARWGKTGGSFKDPLASAGFTMLDLYAGARYWYQEINLNFGAAGTIDDNGLIVSGGRAVAKSGGVDPLAGLRLRHEYAPGHGNLRARRHRRLRCGKPVLLERDWRSQLREHESSHF